MIIANPIYDVVFKRMMENEKVAKFFISTLIDEDIDSIQFKPQEYTYEGEFDLTNPKDVAKYENRIKERFSIWVLRADFIATIRTKDGEQKKVLIEIQKARTDLDLMRFRNYLAEQYKKEDTIEGESAVLPITTIYILGFPLPEIQTPCLKVERKYRNLIDNSLISTTSEFVERLTHDSYIVQVSRITGRFQTKLDKLLSIFEQANFVDDKQIIKEFKFDTDVEEIKLMTDILHYTGTDPVEKKAIENEEEAWRTIDVALNSTRKKYHNAVKEINALEKEMNEKDKAIDEKDKAIDEKDKAIDEKDKAMDEKDKAIDEKDKAIDEKDKAIDEKDKAIDEKDKAIDEKDRLIQELLKKLEGK
jgi:hypothetical protein